MATMATQIPSSIAVEGFNHLQTVELISKKITVLHEQAAATD